MQGMNAMKLGLRLMALVVVFALFLLMSGCLCPGGRYAWGCHGVGETTPERSERLTRQNRIESQQMIDDIDLWFLTDRPSRLGELTVR